MGGRKFRFGFTIREGPNAGLSCGGWRVWTHGEDTYITATSLQGRLKVSLHADTAWQLAYTSEHARADDSLLPSGHGRVMWEFSPAPFTERRRLAFAIAVARNALRPDDTHGAKDVDTIVVEDRWDILTVAKIWMTEPGVDLASETAPLGPPLHLRSGRRVWVTAGWDRIEPAEPEPPPDTAILHIMRPEDHDVACPGLMLVGANLSS